MKFNYTLFVLLTVLLFSACKDDRTETGGETPPSPKGYIDVVVEWCDEAATPDCENGDYIPFPGAEIILYDNELDLSEGEPIIQTKVTNSEGETTFSTTESQIFYIQAVCRLGALNQPVSVAPNQRAQVYFYFEGE